MGTEVLLVEGEDGDPVLAAHLAELDIAVTRVLRADEALAVLRERTFDFVLADLALPDASGAHVVRQLQGQAPDTPLIVLTRADHELALGAVEEGAQDYLVKGQDTPMLLRTLRCARARKQVFNRLLHLTRLDMLTGSGNRAALRERIDVMLARARRHDLAFGVMYIDLDRFKAINDTLGHDAGDVVLREIAIRLRESVRGNDLVARLGGDEFAVLLEDLCPATQPGDVAERLLRYLELPIAVADRELVVTASVGIACYPDVIGSADELLVAADSAMYQAKRRGRNNVVVFGSVVDEQAARLALGTELQHALDRDELYLCFQPQFEVGGHEPVAVEALLRWKRPGHGTVLPTEFIPLLEENGRIVAVGEWVLETACRQLAAWRMAGRDRMRMAVNLSARQFERPGLVACVRRNLERYAIPARFLELEITESLLMSDTARTTTILAELRDLGVRLAIDDFGTGFSSLAYLGRFPVHSLKIDRSFIHRVDEDRERATITSAIVTLGHHLGLEIVAEGVETPEQLAFLAGVRCDLVQGYLLGRPCEAAAI